MRTVRKEGEELRGIAVAGALRQIISLNSLVPLTLGLGGSDLCL